MLKMEGERISSSEKRIEERNKGIESEERERERRKSDKKKEEMSIDFFRSSKS